MNLENRLQIKIKYLLKMRDKYIELNRITQGKFHWREDAISAQIEALEELRDCSTERNWDSCYEEDIRPYKQKG